MKRPLCFISLIITAIVFIYLEISMSKLTNYFPVEPDGTYEETMGIVAEKEIKPSSTGEAVLVIYLIPNNSLQGNFKYIECYLTDRSFEPHIGEMVFLGGKVRAFSSPRNPGEFDSRLYYSTLKIAYRLNDVRILKRGGRQNFIKERLFCIRLFLEDILDKHLEAADASIMKAVLLGDKAFMDDEIKELYKNSGIMHILAVSGLHISIIGMGIYKLLKKLRIPSVLGFITSISIMFLYGSMCGLSTSAFRAICMFTIKALAPIIGRTYDALSALSLAEILLILDQPLYLYNSGFLFSFGAIIAISLVKPKLFYLESGKVVDGIKTAVAVTIVTLPVYMSFYYTFPIYSFFLNLVVLPLMEPLMILGIILLGTGCVSLLVPLAKLEALLIHIILKIYSLLCGGTNRLPGKLLYLGHADKWRIIMYHLLLAIFIFLCDLKINEKLSRYRYYGKWLILLTGIFVLLHRNIPDLQISMIDVGQGDSIVMRTPRETILIDGGSTSKKKVGKYSIIPYLSYEGIGRLDAVIVTHEDTDHISGLFELMDLVEKGEYSIRNLILPDVAEACRGSEYHKLEDRAKELGIPVRYISCGESFQFTDIEIKCLNPVKDMMVDGANEYSTVLFVKCGMFRALLTGDVEGKGQEHLIRDIKNNPEEYENLTALKVAHHGSRYTTDSEFVELIDPKIALISCGEGNSYGHPHKELLKRLEKAGTTVYRTDEGGNISLTMDNGKVQISAYLD